MKKYLLRTIKFSEDIFVYGFVFVQESYLFRKIYTVFYETDNKSDICSDFRKARNRGVLRNR